MSQFAAVGCAGVNSRYQCSCPASPNRQTTPPTAANHHSTRAEAFQLAGGTAHPAQSSSGRKPSSAMEKTLPCTALVPARGCAISSIKSPAVSASRTAREGALFCNIATASAERMHRHTALTTPSHSARRTGTLCGMPSASAAVTKLRVNAAGVKTFCLLLHDRRFPLSRFCQILNPCRDSCR